MTSCLSMFERVVLFGDSYGIPMLMETIPRDNIIAIVVAFNRPENINFIKKYAKEIGVPFFIQPAFSTTEYKTFYRKVSFLQPDCIFCNSYSLLLRSDIIQLVNNHAYNVHASYLPYNRGPNPIQWAILKGESFTGVTLHQMNYHFDSGDIVDQIKVPIEFTDTWVSLKKRLEQVAAVLCSRAIPKILEGQFTTIKQDETRATKNHRLTPDYPEINFNKLTVLQIYNLIRAQIDPLNGAYMLLNDEKYYFKNFVSVEEVRALKERYNRMGIS